MIMDVIRWYKEKKTWYKSVIIEEVKEKVIESVHA